MIESSQGMEFTQQIRDDLKTALRKGDALKVETLRMLLSSLSYKEKGKRYTLSKANPNFSEEELVKNSELSDQEAREVVVSEVKKRREAIEAFEKGRRLDLAEREGKEMEILQAYLPKQISEDEIRKLVKEVLDQMGTVGFQDMGKIMGALMPKLKGKAEGSLISKIVKEMLS